MVEEIIWVKTNQLQRIIRTGRTGVLWVVSLHYAYFTRALVKPQQRTLFGGCEGNTKMQSIPRLRCYRGRGT
jgi:hypothetical protein